MLQRVKGRGRINLSQVFKATLFFAEKVIGNKGNLVIPASCTEPDWENFRQIKPTLYKKEFKKKIDKIYDKPVDVYDLLQLLIRHLQDLEWIVRGYKWQQEHGL